MSADLGTRDPGHGTRMPRRQSLVAGRGSRVLSTGVLLLLGACSWFTDFKQQPKIDPWESVNDTIPFRANPQMSWTAHA